MLENVVRVKEVTYDETSWTLIRHSAVFVPVPTLPGHLGHVLHPGRNIYA